MLQAVRRYSYRYEVVDYRLRAAFGEREVVFVGAFAVGVRGHLDGDVGIVAHHLCHLVESGFRLGTQRRLVKIVKYVVDYHRLVD